MHLWTTGYKVGDHNLQMIEKDKELSANTRVQSMWQKIQGNINLSEVSDVFLAQIEKYQHVHS